MTDEQWTESDDAQLALHALPEYHPVALTVGVWNSLDDLEQHAAALGEWVTPESRDQWGDFTEVAGALADESLSILGTARQHDGVPDVAYVWLIREAADSAARMVHNPEAVNIGAIFTWIWRPDVGGWRLHAVGAEAPPLAVLPRTSPESAPAIDSYRA